MNFSVLFCQNSKIARLGYSTNPSSNPNALDPNC